MVTSKRVLRLSTLKVTKNFSGTPAPSSWARSSRRNSAQGPSATSPEVPDADGGLICTRTWLLLLGPGHCTAMGSTGPWAYFTSCPSTSRMNWVMLASISTARKSSRMDGVRPPPRKNTSRILAARSNWASAEADTAPCPATGLYFHGRLLVSTSGANRF